MKGKEAAALVSGVVVSLILLALALWWVLRPDKGPTGKGNGSPGPEHPLGPPGGAGSPGGRPGGPGGSPAPPAPPRPPPASCPVSAVYYPACRTQKRIQAMDWNQFSAVCDAAPPCGDNSNIGVFRSAGDTSQPTFMLGPHGGVAQQAEKTLTMPGKAHYSSSIDCICDDTQCAADVEMLLTQGVKDQMGFFKGDVPPYQCFHWGGQGSIPWTHLHTAGLLMGEAVDGIPAQGLGDSTPVVAGPQGVCAYVPAWYGKDPAALRDISARVCSARKG